MRISCECGLITFLVKSERTRNAEVIRIQAKLSRFLVDLDIILVTSGGIFGSLIFHLKFEILSNLSSMFLFNRGFFRRYKDATLPQPARLVESTQSIQSSSLSLLNCEAQFDNSSANYRWSFAIQLNVTPKCSPALLRAAGSFDSRDV